jgi:threonyl-tRNA synthetase
MRQLLVHLDRLSVEATTPATEAVDADDPPVGIDAETCLGAFVGVEPDDCATADAVVAAAADELLETADQLRAERIGIVPCPHLLDDPAAPSAARPVVERLAATLADDRDVLRAPVGWHLAVDLSARGHPFSVQSRRIGSGDAETAERDGAWRVLEPERDGDDPDPPSALRALMDALGDPRERRVPVEPLRAAGLADASEDGGALRWMPRGTTARDALLALVEERAAECGAVAVRTPDVAGSHRSWLADAGIEPADLPLALFERRGSDSVTDAGSDASRRGVEETEPTVTVATAGLDGAKREFRRLVDLASALGDELGFEYEVALRATEAFEADNRAWVETIANGCDRSVALELLPDSPGSWSVAAEFAVVDADASQTEGIGDVVRTATVELDQNSAARAGIESVDGGTPTLVRCAPVGAVERVLSALVAQSADTDRPRLPAWVAPTQVRLLPVDERHVARCEDVAARLAEAGVRVDIDDRERTVGERIDAATADLVPFYAVVGDREREAEELPVTDRERGEELSLTVDRLADVVCEEVGDRPQPRRGPSTRLRDRPTFAGGRDR